MPPQGQINRSAAESVLGFVLEISVQHGPAHVVIEFFALNFRRICILDLLPGTLDNIFVIADSLPVAEPLHFLADTLDEVNHQILESSFSDTAALVLVSLDELNLIFAEFLWQRIAEFQFQGISAQYFSSVLLDQGKEDHGEDLVGWTFKQDGSLNRRQSALDAVPLDADLRWKVF